MAPRSVRFGVRSWKISNICQSLHGWPKIFYLELFRALEGMLSRWSRLHLQSLAPTYPQWARVVVYGPFSLRVIHIRKAWAPAVGILIGWWWPSRNKQCGKPVCILRCVLSELEVLNPLLQMLQMWGFSPGKQMLLLLLLFWMEVLHCTKLN
jgi:hypothetical protein